MKLIVKNNISSKKPEEIAISKVTYYEFGFNKYNNFDGNYRIEISIDEFITQLGDIYSECINELKIDDEKTGVFEPLYPGMIDYPHLRELINMPGSIWPDFFNAFLKFDFLSCLFQEGSEIAEYKIVSFDQVIVENQTILFSGKIVST